MTAISRFVTGFCLLAASTVVSACGAPDLTTLKPQVQKTATLVLVVGKPDFVANSTINQATAAQPVIVKTETSTSQSLQNNLNRALQNSDVTSCVIAADDANPLISDMMQIASKYPHVDFEVLSNQQLSRLDAPNIATVSQNQDAIAYAIGWMAGTWATNQMGASRTALQPVFGYAASGLSNDEQKAFFAGLYTSDAAAKVKSVTPPAPPSTGSAVYGIVGGNSKIPRVQAMILGGQSGSAIKTMLQAQSPIIFALNDITSGLKPAVMPGHMDNSHISNVLSQITKGQWQAGAETVIDASSVVVNSHQLGSQAAGVWQSLQWSLAKSPALWKTDYQKLPQATRKMLQSQFGLA